MASPTDGNNNPQRPPEGSTATLSCQHLLTPPSKSLVCGGADNPALHYSTDATAWHCAFSKDGQWLAACYGAPDCAILLWKLTTPKPNTLSNASVPNLSRDDLSQDKATWELQHTLTGIHDRTVRCVAFAPVLSPIIFASASFDGTVCIWEYSSTANDWDCMAQLEGHDNEVKGVSWNATGSLLATCSRDKSVWIWECFLPGTVGGDGSGDFDCIAVLNGHEGDVKSVVFAPSHGQWGDGDEIVLSASYDDTIKCWAEDAGDWYCAASLANVHTATVWSLALAPGGGRLISSSADGSLAIHKCYTEAEKKQQVSDSTNDSNGLWKCVGKLPNAHSLPIYSIDYAPAQAGHGRIASAGGDNRIQIYREAMGSTSERPLFSVDVAVTTTHGDVNCVCWHPTDGSMLASAGDDGTIRIWNYNS